VTTGKAQQLVITSAAVVAGVYAYRRYGGKTQTTLGTFVTAWGTIFFILALGAEAAPGVSGAMALLVMTADLLANTSGPNGLAAQVQAGLSGAGVGAATSSGPGSSGPAVTLSPTPAPSPSVFHGATVPHGYHKVAGGVAANSVANPSRTVPNTLAAAAAAEGLHYDPATNQYVP